MTSMLMEVTAPLIVAIEIGVSDFYEQSTGPTG